MACLVNGESVNRHIYSIFQRFNRQWKETAPQASYTSRLTPLKLPLD